MVARSSPLELGYDVYVEEVVYMICFGLLVGKFSNWYNFVYLLPMESMEGQFRPKGHYNTVMKHIKCYLAVLFV
mgnify:FL=1